MASLLVRNVDAGLVRLLKIRAAEHGCSAEAEHRRILTQALSQPLDPGFDRIAAEMRRRTGQRRQTSSEVLMRESRRERTEQIGR